MRRVMTAVFVCVTVLLGQAALAADFNDSANVNVLRQYDPATGTNLVATSYELIGVSMQGRGPNDGSGLVCQFDGVDSADDRGIATFDLPGERTVGSYMVAFASSGYRPAAFVLEGFDGTDWVELENIDPIPADYLAGAFDSPATVSKIRATCVGPSTGGSYVLYNELHVYMTTGQTVDLNDGYNYMPEQYADGFSSSNSAVWGGASSGPGVMVDRNFTSHVKKADDATGSRCFLLFDLGAPIQMSAATLGGYHGQTWSNWECYTAPAGEPPALQDLEANDSLTIQAAGWTLQHTHGAGSNAMDFTFDHAGQYRWVTLVWDVEGGACVQFELFGGIVPAKVIAFEVADQTTGDTTYTESRTVNVTAFDAAPSSGGTSIVGYMVTGNRV